GLRPHVRSEASCVAEHYLAVWHKRRTTPAKQMQRVVNPAADNEGAATRQPGDATEAVRDLECLQPAASALADCIAENILRRLLLDELPVGPVVLVETAGQNEHLALVGADRDRRRTIGDVGGVGSNV